MEVIKKYSTIDYAVLKELDISPNELAYIDMVYYLSKAGTEWCYKSLRATADDLNLGKSTVKSMRDRLIDKKLLKRNDKGHVKSTETVHLSYGVRISHGKQSKRAKSNPHRAKYERNRAKSAPKSYIENNKENSLAYKKARKKAEEIRQSLLN